MSQGNAACQLLSTTKELQQIVELIQVGAKIPLGGEFKLEDIVAYVHNGHATHSKAFADVVADDVGFQVKKGETTSPLTWKRLSVSDSELKKASRTDPVVRQTLGDILIADCNEVVKASFNKYGVQAIVLSRLIIHPRTRAACYYERLLATRGSPVIFRCEEFEWTWSAKSLHGKHRHRGDEWFAWYGLGENQLHFKGEKNWFPCETDVHYIIFDLPDKLPLEIFLERMKE